MAAFIKDEAGIDVELNPKGKIGEFTVWVGDTLVENKNKLKFPDKKKILAAVQQGLQEKVTE